MIVFVDRFISDQGSLLIFGGTIDGGPERRVTFASDHGPASPILADLLAGGYPEAEVPAWAMLGWTQDSGPDADTVGDAIEGEFA